MMRSKAGVSEGFSELDELFSQMREARADLEASKMAAKAAESELKKTEESSGAFVVERALKRRCTPDLDARICEKYG